MNAAEVVGLVVLGALAVMVLVMFGTLAYLMLCDVYDQHLERKRRRES